jgi:flavin-dependent dehydrogenase
MACVGAPIVVVGGGPAGSTTATLLARRGANVVLFDSARFPRRKACAEYVSPGGAAILAQLGLDLRDRGRWLRGMEIRAPSGACHALEYRGGRQLGLSIARVELDTALLDLAKESGVDVREGCRVASVITASERATGARDAGHRVTGVKLATGGEQHADFVIGADGMHSVVARAAGKPLRPYWPRRIGLVAHYAGVAWPEAHGQMWVSSHGYVGVAPLDNHGLLSVGLVGPLHSTHFDAALAAHYPQLAHRLSVGRQQGPIIGIGPLRRRTRATAGTGYLLVGDAAGFFDPFTGEGIYRALKGAQLAAASLTDDLDYTRLRKRAFAAKAQLTVVIQVFVHQPRLLDLALRRLRQRPRVAERLGNMLGDLEPASLDVVWQLLRP